MNLIAKVSLLSTLCVIGAVLLFSVIRLLAKPQKSKKSVFILGSGGHTREMMHILSLLKPEDPVFIHADSDQLSKERVEKMYPNAQFIPIVRARQVKQSYFTAIFTTLRAFFASFKIIKSVNPHVLITNGPGTALPLVVATFILNLFHYTDCKLIFVESYCRIEHLSLTGKICRFFVDEFIVNWPDIKKGDMDYIEVFPK